MISKPRYRFFLGGQQISEPIGWNSIRLVLERDTILWSLVESVEQPFEFVADGYVYIKDARRNGINAQITFESDISWDGGNTWEEFFNGLLDLTTLIEIENKKRFQCTLLRTGAWAKFINRRSTKVDVSDVGSSTTLPTQEIRKIFRSEQFEVSDPGYDYFFYMTDPTNKYCVVQLPSIVTDEIDTRYTLANGVQSVVPVPFMVIKEAGEYTFESEIYISNVIFGFGTAPTDIFVILQIGTTTLSFARTDLGTPGIDGVAKFTAGYTATLTVDTPITLYIVDDNAPQTIVILPKDQGASFLEITADTTTTDTEAEGFFIHDVTRSIVNETSEDPEYFYSKYFAGINTQSVEYDEAGCGSLFKLFKGINVRGESLDDHPFTMSFDDMWRGIDNIFCLGCGYEVVAFVSDGVPYSKEVVRIEQRDYFFDDSEDSIELDVFNWDENLEISYDAQFLVTAIKIGFEKWQAETLVGTDDPQTQHDYSTILKTAGTKDSKDKKILSSFYAASSGIEETRRKTFEPRKDWRLDEETFIVQTDVNGDVETYPGSQITNLLNDSTRYNIRLTPATNFNRWASWLSIAFQEYPEQLFYFEGGQGNINMIYFNAGATGCDSIWGAYVNERGNIPIVTSPFLPDIYKFAVPFNWEQWKAVRNNRNKSIRLNYQNNAGNISSVSLFVKTLEYEPNQSLAKFECWFKAASPLLFGESQTIGSWRIIYNSDFNFVVDLPSPGGSGSVTLKGASGTVPIDANKYSNGGSAEADGMVEFYQDGVLVHTENFVNTANVTSVPYFYTGLTGAETLRVVITEI